MRAIRRWIADQRNLENEARSQLESTCRMWLAGNPKLEHEYGERIDVFVELTERVLVILSGSVDSTLSQERLDADAALRLQIDWEAGAARWEDSSEFDVPLEDWARHAAQHVQLDPDSIVPLLLSGLRKGLPGVELFGYRIEPVRGSNSRLSYAVREEVAPIEAPTATAEKPEEDLPRPYAPTEVEQRLAEKDPDLYDALITYWALASSAGSLPEDELRELVYEFELDLVHGDDDALDFFRELRDANSPPLPVELVEAFTRRSALAPTGGEAPDYGVVTECRGSFVVPVHSIDGALVGRLVAQEPPRLRVFDETISCEAVFKVDGPLDPFALVRLFVHETRRDVFVELPLRTEQGVVPGVAARAPGFEQLDSKVHVLSSLPGPTDNTPDGAFLCRDRLFSILESRSSDEGSD